MQLITSIVGFVFSDLTTFIICAIIGWITYYLSKYYLRVWSLPKGPTPLPLFGNVLAFRGRKPNNIISATEITKPYGPMATLWLGSQPMVMLNDFELAKEAFKKSEFSGRTKVTFFELLKGKNNEMSDILFDDFCRRWESNRRVAHAAVRKYAVSDKLPTLVEDVINEIIKEMIEKENDNCFDPSVYVKSIYNIILASSAFGKRYKLNDPDLVRVLEIQSSNEDPRLAIVELLPFMRVFFRNLFNKIIKDNLDFVDFVKNKFTEHLKNFDENQIRDFCDAMILAKREAIVEAKESAQYLTDDNLSLALFDLFLAGSDTSQGTTRWFILYMANYPEYQTKMRQEIASVIGNRIPVQDDRNECNLVNAFLHEVLRSRPNPPIAVPHKAMVDAKLGDCIIPKDTGLILNIWAIHQDPKNFPEPDQFKPERFLDSSGRFVTQKPAAFIPFGTGRRACLGEKLAIADIFLVVANILQKTNSYEFVMKDGAKSADLEMNPQNEGNCTPKEFQMFLRKIEKC